MPREEFDKAPLAAHHLDKLTAFQQFVVVAHCHNWPPGRVAKPPATRCGRSRTQPGMYTPPGYGRKGLLGGVWASLHGECCLLQGWEAFKEAVA